MNSISGVMIPWRAYASCVTTLPGLARSGFDVAQSAFFVWLGVVPYLTQEAIEASLNFIAATPGSERLSRARSNGIRSSPRSESVSVSR